MLYLKSLSMAKEAIVWGNQALESLPVTAAAAAADTAAAAGSTSSSSSSSSHNQPQNQNQPPPPPSPSAASPAAPPPESRSQGLGEGMCVLNGVCMIRMIVVIVSLFHVSLFVLCSVMFSC